MTTILGTFLMQIHTDQLAERGNSLALCMSKAPSKQLFEVLEHQRRKSTSPLEHKT